VRRIKATPLSRRCRARAGNPNGPADGEVCRGSSLRGERDADDGPIKLGSYRQMKEGSERSMELTENESMCFNLRMAFKARGSRVGNSILRLIVTPEPFKSPSSRTVET
jgi:hypothetical protein